MSTFFQFEILVSTENPHHSFGEKTSRFPFDQKILEIRTILLMGQYSTSEVSHRPPEHLFYVNTESLTFAQRIIRHRESKKFAFPTRRKSTMRKKTTEKPPSSPTPRNNANPELKFQFRCNKTTPLLLIL